MNLLEELPVLTFCIHMTVQTESLYVEKNSRLKNLSVLFCLA